MLGKIIGAFAGRKAARHISDLNSPTGAVLGAGAVAVARRLGPIGLVAAVAGGYAFKRYHDKKAGRDDGAVTQPSGEAFPD